jgi:hypothetical protein
VLPELAIPIAPAPGSFLISTPGKFYGRYCGGGDGNAFKKTDKVQMWQVYTRKNDVYISRMSRLS